MNDTSLEIAPPRRAFLFIFLIAGIVLFLNGLAVLVFAPIPRTTGAIQPSFGVGGWMPIVAGLLCFAGAGWMLNRHRRVALIAELVQAELPPDGYDQDSRDTLIDALFERAGQLSEALVTFPDALVAIELRLADDHQLEVEYTARDAISARLSSSDDRLVEQVGKQWECVALDDEILIDIASVDRARSLIETLTQDILKLPPDFELSGDIRVSRRNLQGQL